MKVRFHSVYDKISQALKGMPYDELGISDEEKEQVDFTNLEFITSMQVLLLLVLCRIM